MQPSSSFCRTQEARQHALAADATLTNVRDIATLAATVWAKEALSADKREARALRTADARLALETDAFSENPDRGRADRASARG